MSTVIKIENISKLYRLGTIGSGTLQNDLKRWWAKINKKEDPFQKIGERNIQNKSGISNQIWALKDINLEVNQGDVLGIIGKNGAGKSTLLKILSRITSPTTGIARIKGRIASLLEIGTGFHPDLTGRENIYLNGAILGMLRNEIDQRLDEIIDYSGIERYIDTPVKRYSSGMYVRLAFAVAAHLEPEILLIDEVLAVGDISFQAKCLRKMDSIAKQGRTVLFVSHNIGSIRVLCDKAILLENGKLKYKGTAVETIDKYLEGIDKADEDSFNIEEDKIAYVTKIKITDINEKSLNTIPIYKPYKIIVSVTITSFITDFILGVGFSTFENVSLRTIWLKPTSLDKGEYLFIITEDNIYYTGKYQINLGLSMLNGKETIQYLQNAKTIKFENYVDKNMAFDTNCGLIINQQDVEIKLSN
ncbi:MAG: ATP-binding cassette domain-containing protein [Candidatus Marinimicrobia bacterium]|nr:ATP-binding cassette domain-containing protein [Candidatus Neomarinimicrobiota bacterium]